METTYANTDDGTCVLTTESVQVREAKEIQGKAKEVRVRYADEPAPYGRVAVLFRKRNNDDSMFYVPDWVKEEEANRGGVRETRWCPVIFSTYPGVDDEDIVATYLDARCLIKDQNDDPLIPEDYEVRIFGVHEDCIHCIAGVYVE